MIKHILYNVFYFFEINNHPAFVQLFRTAINSYYRIMTMKTCTLAFIGQSKLMRHGNFQTFLYVIHFDISLLYYFKKQIYEINLDSNVRTQEKRHHTTFVIRGMVYTKRNFKDVFDRLRE